MRYEQFKKAIQDELRGTPDGLTWMQLRDQLRLPYDRPCPTWVRCLEREIGLSRARGSGAAHIWKLSAYQPLNATQVA